MLIQAGWAKSVLIVCFIVVETNLYGSVWGNLSAILVSWLWTFVEQFLFSSDNVNHGRIFRDLGVLRHRDVRPLLRAALRQVRQARVGPSSPLPRREGHVQV